MTCSTNGRKGAREEGTVFMSLVESQRERDHQLDQDVVGLIISRRISEG
jgi:hypothetical protein